jgi:HEAT repeat protein
MAWLMSPLPPRWHAALRDVNAQGVQARVAAAVRLGEPDGDAQAAQALEVLPQLTSDKDARVRGAAVQALGAIGDDRSLGVLERCLGDSHELVREHATIALGELSWEAAGPLLLAATRSPHAELRFQSILSAAAGSPEEAQPHIKRLLGDDDPRVRASAVEAAGSLDLDSGDPATARVLEKLVTVLADPEPAVRRRASLLTARSHPRVSAPVLAEALDDPELVLAALDAVPAVRDAALIERVAALTQRVLVSRLLVAAAARALARLGDRRAVPALREVLTAWRPQGRTHAVQTVGELQLVELAPELVALARRPRSVDPSVLATSLARLAPRSPDSAGALRQLADRPDEFAAPAREALKNDSGIGHQ